MSRDERRSPVNAVRPSTSNGRSNGPFTNSIIARINHLPTWMVPIDSLVSGYSARASGHDSEHVKVLMQMEDSLPPIIVHRPTMRIIDGEHRAQAAQLRGEREIRVRFFDGDEQAAFIFSVQANIAQGLPLTLADRTAAAARILSFRPEWSDRAIARMTGLSAAAVGAIRRRSTVQDEQLNVRLGRDGRRRPVNAALGRAQASELITKKPDASLREIANEVGLSIATVRDVRKRMAQHRHPVPPSQRKSLNMYRPRDRSGLKIGRPSSRKCAAIRPPAVVLERFKRDPSLRSTEPGRMFLKWLTIQINGVDRWEQFVDHIPPHSVIMMWEAAHGIAHAWEGIADKLDQRANSQS